MHLPHTTPVPGPSAGTTAFHPIVRRWLTWNGCYASTQNRLRHRSDLGLRPIEEFLIDLRRQNEIAFRQSVDFVRISLDFHTSPSQRDIRMVTFGLGDRAHAVDEIECCFEIRESVSLGD